MGAMKTLSFGGGISQFRCVRQIRTVMRASFVLNALMVMVLLRAYGAVEVRENLNELIFCALCGVWLLAMAERMFPWLGLSLADDAWERRNWAALWALCAARTGVGLLYALGSAGEGPSYFNNVFTVCLGMFAWFVLWAEFELCTKASRSVAEERDLASGLRLGAFLLAEAMVIGHAIAGTWHSEAATVHDLVSEALLPTHGLLLVACVVERSLRPSTRRPVPSWLLAGLAPASALVLLAVRWLLYLGPWEGMPN